VSKKSKSRQPHHPAHPSPPEVDPDDYEEELEEEQEEPIDMSDEPKTPEGESVHPDPEGKMVSYAPGFTVGSDGGSMELPKEEKKDE
jgi:hypothetical protein